MRPIDIVNARITELESKGPSPTENEAHEYMALMALRSACGDDLQPSNLGHLTSVARYLISVKIDLESRMMNEVAV